MLQQRSAVSSFIPTIAMQTLFAYRHFWLQGMCERCQAFWRTLLHHSSPYLRNWIVAPLFKILHGNSADLPFPGLGHSSRIPGIASRDLLLQNSHPFFPPTKGLCEACFEALDKKRCQRGAEPRTDWHLGGCELFATEAKTCPVRMTSMAYSSVSGDSRSARPALSEDIWGLRGAFVS